MHGQSSGKFANSFKNIQGAFVIAAGHLGFVVAAAVTDKRKIVGFFGSG